MKLFKIIYILSFLLPFKAYSQSDVTVMGPIKYADGIQGVAYSLIDILKSNYNVNFAKCGIGSVSYDQMSLKIKEIVDKSFSKSTNVLIFTSLVSNFKEQNLDVPQASIKIAYSMLEATSIPQSWTSALNTNFDAVVVPDEWLISVYKNSGVTIPIFVLPLPVYLDDFLELPNKIKPNRIFTFGISAGFGTDKNHELLLNSFEQEFRNEKNVKLLIHGRGNNKITDAIKQKIKTKFLQNKVSLLNFEMPRANYVKFISSLDCYVLLSRGEGFSITPREAMAAGIPCILSNNTAHKTICNTGLVEPVKAEILTNSDYTIFGNFNGKKFNCTVADARAALRNVYNNYSKYLGLAKKSRSWVTKYKPENLRAYYNNLIKPKDLILGEENIITEDKLITNSKALYQKYKNLN